MVEINRTPTIEAQVALDWPYIYINIAHREGWPTEDMEDVRHVIGARQLLE